MDPGLIAAALREIAIYLELEGEKFRARAYARAAASLDASRDAARLIAEGRVGELPGVGDSIAALVGDLARDGGAPLIDRLRAAWPVTLVELARLPGVGVPKARRLIDELGIDSLDQLAELCDQGAIRALPGFGKASEEKIKNAIRSRHEQGKHLLHEEARELSASLAAHLVGARVEICGPVRRWIEVVDALALAVATTDEDAVRERLRSHPLVVSLAVEAPGRAVARMANNVLCTLYTVHPDSFGTAVIRATGSEAHVEMLRARGLDDARGDEEQVYRALGLPWIPPECRDGTDELTADLSDLVTLADLTGAVHAHTVASDGKHTIAEMARAAEERGFRFLTITDHSQTAGYAGGLTPERLRAQAGEIATAQANTSVRLLHGTESDIRKDGALDFDDDDLAALDLVIASVHQRYKLDEDGMTARIVAMVKHPLFKIWGHALGRMLLRRDPIAIRFDEVLDAIATSRIAIEINGDPHRLDLDPARARAAAARGAKFVLSCDAHSTRQLDYTANAVAMARRARIRRRDVLNALPPDEFARAVAPK